MRYLPHTPEEIKKMCQLVGVASTADLFHVIPEEFRLKNPLDLPQSMPETELVSHLKNLGRTNENVDTVASFLGGGAYHHYIPVLVSAITSRGEFLSAYTPYQPEISQGTLQAVFEFQTMIASLTGMDLANASNYDGASALAESALMAMRVTKRSKILVASSTHPQYREVLKTYLKNRDCEVLEFGWETSGRVDVDSLKKLLDENVAAVCVQSPNAFGVIENFAPLAALAHDKGALMVGNFSEAMSLGLLKPLGHLGADIVVGEGQSFGNFLNLGGPYLGLFATKEKFVRQMPGRLVGETIDTDHKRGYVLVLSTREQHIRREKATSNICTNQGLCALATAIYLSVMGPKGLKKVAEINYANAHYLRKNLSALPHVRQAFSSPHFNEFVLHLPVKASEALNELRKKNIFAGIDLTTWYPQLENSLLVCSTEMNTKAQMDHYVASLKEILR